MVEYNEQNIKFGWLTKDEMLSAISDGKLNQHDICFTKDTHEEYIINSNLEPISIKSRLRIFSSVEVAIEEINKTPSTYSGEILSINDGDKFIAYVVNKFEDGKYYITPVYSDSMIDYNELQNTPVKNINGDADNPISISELEDGWYKIAGYFKTPLGTVTTSVVGNLFIIDTSIEGKKIKRICNDVIIDYYIDNDGNVTNDKYATQQYIESKGYATDASVDIKLEAFKLAMQDYIEEYVETTVSLLVRFIVNEELASRYSTNQDIQDLFN